MRKAVLATLALSPMLLHAQANLPAQPQTSVASPLYANLSSETPNPAEPNHPVTHRRVSTGVVAPKLIHSENITTRGDARWSAIPMHAKAVVNLVVDAEGKPTNIQLEGSFGPAMNRNIVESVSRYRFQPGTVSNQPVPAPVTLELNINNLGL